MNFVAGWVTDFTTAYVSKQQGVVLSAEPHVEG
jgi:PTS system glucitol/sorbitol-specific IIC component